MGQSWTTKLRAAGVALATGLLAACGEDAADTGSAEIDTTAAETEDAVDIAEQATQPDPQIWAEENQAYLAENAENDDVTVTESGLQYRVVKEAAEDAPRPESGDMVTVHYSGRLIDGTEFDSSYLRDAPATFRSDRLIAGWVEALPMMQVGDKWELTIPAELGYGEAGAGEGRIPPNSTLIFEVELVDLPDAEEASGATGDSEGS